jgi:HAD superfamily phosphatase (TIGR01668 family)
LLERFFPNEYVNSVYLIDYNKLLNMGINSAIFDIDNTLVPHYIERAPKNIRDLFEKLKGMGFKICLLSNNNERRVQNFKRGIDILSVSMAGKPSLRALNKAMVLLNSQPESTCIIGDQVFTDIYCGNRKKIYTILVKPVVNKDEIIVRIKRGFERKVIEAFSRKGGR